MMNNLGKSPAAPRARLNGLVQHRLGAALVSITMLLIGGCALGPSEEPAAEPEPPAIETPEETPEAVAPAAVTELVSRAETASAAGRNASAAADLERALRIAPRSAVLWQNLAVVRYRQGQYGAAENFAERSNSLAAGDAALKRRNWRLIAAARRQQGDVDGAEAAARRASEQGKY